jgi:hypothetical protein
MEKCGINIVVQEGFLVSGGLGFIDRNVMSMILARRINAMTLDITGRPCYRLDTTKRNGLKKIPKNLT